MSDVAVKNTELENLMPLFLFPQNKLSSKSLFRFNKLHCEISEHIIFLIIHMISGNLSVYFITALTDKLNCSASLCHLEKRFEQ